MSHHYFDCAASCLPTAEAIEAARSFDAQEWSGANPNSLHSYGRAAFSALEKARATLSRSVGAKRPSEIVFTSGGTESNNMAVLGLAMSAFKASSGQRRRVLISAIEHDSILALEPRLRALGFAVQHIPVLPTGIIDLAALSSLLGDDVALVSVMWVNNEIGTIQPIRQAASLAHAQGALVHTDAVQALGKTPCGLDASGIDAASITAHKLGGPVGIGALYLRAHTRMEPLLLGGGQEAGLRSGTVDVRGATIFAAAADAATRKLESNRSQERRVALVLLEGLVTGDRPVARLACDVEGGSQFVPGIVCLIVKGHDSQSLSLALDNAGFEVSGGSACSSRSLEPSHVMRALGISRDDAFCELRLSFDARATVEDAQELVRALHAICDEGGAR